LFNFLIQF